MHDRAQDEEKVSVELLHDSAEVCFLQEPNPDALQYC
jgi:hypothetical protein